MADYTAGWLRFFEWAMAGACFALGITAVGVFTLPLGALVAVLLTKPRRSNGRERLGLLEGAGAIIVLIGVRNLNGMPLFVVGGAVMLLTGGTYWWLSSPRRNPPPGGISSSLPG